MCGGGDVQFSASHRAPPRGVAPHRLAEQSRRGARRTYTQLHTVCPLTLAQTHTGLLLGHFYAPESIGENTVLSPVKGGRAAVVGGDGGGMASRFQSSEVSRTLRLRARSQ